jgi:hypothetical protein
MTDRQVGVGDDRRDVQKLWGEVEDFVARLGGVALSLPPQPLVEENVAGADQGERPRLGRGSGRGCRRFG